MIRINLLDSSFNHEVTELIKAFYPREEVTISYGKNPRYTIDNEIVGEKVYTRLYEDKILLEERFFMLDKEYEKRDIKNNIKKHIYEILEARTDINVPWGILTGIRPSKLVHTMMDDGIKEDEIGRILKEDYKMEKDKRDLIYNIVANERKHIYPLDKEKYSIYISIPFCPTTCLYCSFPSCNSKVYRDEIEIYTDTLIRELEEVSKYAKRDKISTVYIGGGTPTAIPVENLDRIIRTIYRLYDRDNIDEFTVEAGRPDTINDDFLKMFKSNKIDRISINPQTMNDETLKIIGRSHKSIDIERVYYRARELGDYIINMDMIVGLPNENIEEVKYSMERIKSLDPENLTVHTLSVKKGSRFKDTMDQYEIEDENIIEDMLDITRDYAGQMDMRAYYLYRQKQSMGNFENIGYAKEDKECLYNIHMMEERQTILAFGMGAVSKIFYPDSRKIKRVPNVKSLEEYLKRHDEMIGRKIGGLEKMMI